MIATTDADNAQSRLWRGGRVLETTYLNLVIPIKRCRINMADAVLERSQTLVAPELQADASKDRLAHMVGKDSGPTCRFGKAVLVLAASRAGAETSPPKAPAVEDFKQVISIRHESGRLLDGIA